ncbi:MAG: MBL fold metallo-hydrolase [Bacteroidales bacterium]|jgi:7,8-dihydropterin-6-yl-methyl-4-(beta-D-ribofuranosyl)aminobenzene 5'-phosphate synthase|nr:MBL fold metallo-hydrolase [Bacteroidales bacterium]MCI2145393.1 MBL fold metallo-hydrolase [Bacteroidales bacterium]
MVKITVLADNRPDPGNEALGTEHGLSFYIEFEGKKLLCDTGASSLFAENAKRLGVDLGAVDSVFLSHGHYDHTGGLKTFLETNDTAKVYMSDKIFGRKFYSSRHTVKREIGTDGSLQKAYAGRFALIPGSCRISENIALVFNDSHEYPIPAANRFLTIADNDGERPDDFSHEMSLVFNTPKGLAIISSCSHCGALNIIDSCSRFTGIGKVAAFVGGMHFVDYEGSEREVGAFSTAMAQVAPETIFYAGHCTGERAKAWFASHGLSEKVKFFHTGSEFFV